MTGAGHSEGSRQAVHMLTGAFALLLRFVPWWQAAILATAALLFNLVLLPRLWPRLYRPADLSGGHPSGILLYPLAVLLLILLFPYRLDIAASAWGILAVGDGAATLVGRAVKSPRLPWNREKSVAGSLALFLCGGAAGAFLAWWCRPAVVPPPYLWFSLGLPFVAALVAAAVETIPIRLDDNVSVPVSAAATLWAGSLIDEELLRAAAIDVLPALPLALALNAGVAWAGYLARTVSTSGAVAGAALGALILATTGWGGWILLLATFGVASASSRIGLHRKQLLGIAEERSGRRGAGNAVANTGVAALAGILAVVTDAHDAALLAFTAALVAGGSDTVASEVGKAWGRTPYLLSTLREVPPGTPGAVSPEGTAAGLVGAMGLGGVAVAAGLISATALAPVVAGATAGALVESVLGATLEGPGILNNDVLNFTNTAVAAAAAIALTSLFG